MNYQLAGFYLGLADAKSKTGYRGFSVAGDLERRHTNTVEVYSDFAAGYDDGYYSMSNLVEIQK